MNCPDCHSTNFCKNGRRRGRQCYKCKDCGRQFLDSYAPPRAYPQCVKALCLRMYVNGLGFRAIERVAGVNHNTVINWVKDAGSSLSDCPRGIDYPLITELDELQTFVGKKKNKLWIWTAVDHWQPGIQAWVIGDRSSETFKYLWQIVSCWGSFWYVTDGWKVYPKFLEGLSHLVSKTYMTRVEGENCRLRHYLARLKRKGLCYSKSQEMLEHSLRLLLHYLHHPDLPIFA